MGRKAIHGIDLYTSKCGIYSCNFLWAKICFQIGHILLMAKVELQGSNTIPCLSHLIQLCQKKHCQKKAILQDWNVIWEFLKLANNAGNIIIAKISGGA